MGSAQSTKAVDAAADRVSNGDVTEDETTPEHSSSSSVEDCTSLSESAISTPAGISEASDVSAQGQLSVCGSPHPSRHSAILIFDLDDTLIPTEWIRSSFAAQKHKHATADEVYQLLDDEDIPIIRSCPVGEEPSIHEAPAYFAYWMNAKQLKDIALAIDCLFEEATPCATRRVGATVTYTIQ
ncbi:hypothetical protein Emed_000284 [Eimeria media]